MEFLLAAISLGFLGSFHCVGMCGPIALALPVHNKTPLEKNLLIALYNFGRILTYSAFGLLAGIVGKSFALAGLQQTLSITLGIILLLSVFLPFSKSVSGYGFFLWIKTSLSKAFSKNSKTSLFVIGLLNGFLPCGLVYTGIVGAAATGDIVKGILFMTFFGLGTVPMMYALPIIGNSISISMRNTIKKITPIAVGIVAVFLIARGLNLGIPYLSPKLNTETESVNCCHDNSKVIKCEKPH